MWYRIKLAHVEENINDILEPLVEQTGAEYVLHNSMFDKMRIAIPWMPLTRIEIILKCLLSLALMNTHVTPLG